jgi:hypothetical protein
MKIIKLHIKGYHRLAKVKYCDRKAKTASEEAVF